MSSSPATDTSASLNTPDARSTLALRARATLVLAALATFAAAVVSYWAIWRIGWRESARQRLLDDARLGAALLTDWTAEDFSPPPAASFGGLPAVPTEAALEFKRWSLAVLKHPGTIATAVIDPNGAPVTSWPPSHQIAASLPGPPPSAADGVYDAVDSPSAEQASAGTVAVAAIDRGPQLGPLAYVWLNRDLGHPPRWPGGRFAGFVGVLAVLTTIVVAVATRRLQRLVFEPIAELSGQLREATSHRRPHFPVERADEIGSIARGLHELCEQLHCADQHADRLKLSIDSVVARQTKHISRLLRRAESEAEVDSLTRLANRRFIEQRLEPLFREHGARKVNLAVIMFDVDNFKSLNDTAGHLAGDSILRLVGELLRGALRESDVGVRYGGDEFLLLLVDVTTSQAEQIAERIVRLFAQRMSITGFQTKVTLSAGVASLSDVEAGSASDLMAKADQALYKSKQAGKNRAQSAR